MSADPSPARPLLDLSDGSGDGGGPGDHRGDVIRVVHFGDAWWMAAGGISTVIRRHLTRQLDGFRTEAVATVDPAARGLIRRNKHLPAAWWALLRLRRGRTVAHVHLSQRGSLLREGSFLVTARLLGIRSVVTVHGSSTAAQGRLARALMGRVVRQASAVHVLSELHRERLGIGRPRGQLVLVAGNDSAVPEAVPPLPERSKTFLFGGRIGFRKGVDVLLRAWTAAETDGWRLLLAGPVDDDFGEILSSAQSRDDSIVGLGPVAPEHVLEQLLAAQVAILPSRAEAMPMFLVEAAAAGCAVIGTSVGGVPELLGHGRYGLVATPDDVADLTRCINDLVRDESLRSSLGAAGRRRAVARAAEASRQWASAYRALAQDSRETGRPADPQRPAASSS